ncbi:hypothetical protein MRX96_035722 [Rhipicephalus microplus]
MPCSGLPLQEVRVDDDPYEARSVARLSATAHWRGSAWESGIPVHLRPTGTEPFDLEQQRVPPERARLPSARSGGPLRAEQRRRRTLRFYREQAGAGCDDTSLISVSIRQQDGCPASSCDDNRCTLFG